MAHNTDSSDDSSSSSSSEHHRRHHRRKSEKRKHKKKSSKKSKKHERKRSSSRKERLWEKKDDPRGEKMSKIQPNKYVSENDQINTFRNEERREKDNHDTNILEGDVFGPVLPPHLLKKTETRTFIGPQMPEDRDGYQLTTQNAEGKKNTNSDEEETDPSTEIYGPLPPKSNTDLTKCTQEYSGNQLLLEERALELKMAAIDGCFPVSGQKSDPDKREEWMMELPEVGLKRNVGATGGADILNLLKRGFHQGKEKPNFDDRSEWTKTPGSNHKNAGSSSKHKESPTASLKRKAMENETKRRDQEQEALAKKYRRQDKEGGKVKAEESLVEKHQRRLREEEKERRKNGPEKVERRPFNRDVDLKLIKIDRNQTKQIVKNAKLLDSKFASGKAKYL